MNIKNKIAFTMIEGAIVMVVMSLLISAIVGAASLLRHAKVLILIDEIRNYTQDVKRFKLDKRRWPGDINHTGKIGLNSGQIYNDGSFGEPYISTNAKYGLPTASVGPLVELFQTGYIDFEPRKYDSSLNNLDWDNGGAPSSRAFEQLKIFFDYQSKKEGEDIAEPIVGYIGPSLIFKYAGSDMGNYITLDIMRNIDKKLDDQFYNKGLIRAYCSSTLNNYTNYVGYEASDEYGCRTFIVHLEQNNL